MSNIQPTSASDNNTPVISPGNFSPVTVYMADSIGAVFLGILAMIMLIGWRRAEMRYRAVLKQQME